MEMEKLHQQMGAVLSSLEHNNKLTEKISDKVDKIDHDVSTLAGVVHGHEKYLKNLDDRIVVQRANHEALHERVTIIETKNDSSTGIFKWMAGILASVIGALITFFALNK